MRWPHPKRTASQHLLCSFEGHVPVQNSRSRKIRMRKDTSPRRSCPFFGSYPVWKDMQVYFRHWSRLESMAMIVPTCLHHWPRDCGRALHSRSIASPDVLLVERGAVWCRPLPTVGYAGTDLRWRTSLKGRERHLARTRCSSAQGMTTARKSRALYVPRRPKAGLRELFGMAGGVNVH